MNFLGCAKMWKINHDSYANEIVCFKLNMKGKIERFAVKELYEYNVCPPMNANRKQKKNKKFFLSVTTTFHLSSPGILSTTCITQLCRSGSHGGSVVWYTSVLPALVAARNRRKKNFEVADFSSSNWRPFVHGQKK